MRRFVPSPGLYVSVQKFGFSTFRVDGSSISKVLFGGVGGFQELFLAGITDVHPIQQAIQADLDHLPTPFNYIAGIALESVADPTPITAQHIREKLPTMVKLSIPYAVDQLKKMASVEGLEEIAVEVIEQVVLQVVLKKAAEFIIEKVGTKFIPVVNIAFSVYDVVSAVWYGMDEMKRVVDAICALALALGGKTVDEDTIAAKVLGRIMADEFKDEVVQALTKYAAEHATGAKGKPKEHAAPKSEPAPPPPAPAMPEAHPSTPHAGGAPGITGGPQPEPRPPAPVHDQPAAVTQGVVDPATASTTTGEKAASTPPPDPAATTAVPDSQTRGVGDRKTETAGAAAPEIKETGTDTRGTEAAGTDTPATDATGTASKPPAPKRKGTKKKKVELPPGVEPSDAPDAPIMQIGVHDRSDAPLRSGRKLQEARPESGGQMGFQTQIGPELVTAIGSPGKEVKVTSLNPDVLIGADTVRFRDDALAIIVKDDKHPMRRLVDQDKFRAAPYGQHGDMTLWKQHPYDWQSGHAQSHRQGGADVIVFQTRYRNQKQSALLERHGFVTMDEVFVIGGIGVEKRSAWDLFHAGYLDLTLDQMKSLPTLKL
jgi:hypothetical protein